jgi:hypothetical protein
MSYRVMVDDNFHYMDKSRRYLKGEYAAYAEALAMCREIVDQFLRCEYVSGMPASALYFRYMMFGEDPFIVDRSGPPDPSPGFSAWDYAKVRCQELCAPASEASAACA